MFTWEVGTFGIMVLGVKMPLFRWKIFFLFDPKAKGMKKCTILVGSAEIKNNARIAALLEELNSVNLQKRDRARELDERLVNTSKKAVKARQNIMSIKERESARYNRKIDKLNSTIGYWRETSPAYSFKFERIIQDISIL